MAFAMKAGVVCAIIGVLNLPQFAETPAAHAAETHGMVVTAQHLATDVGLKILQQAVELIKVDGSALTGANDHRRPAGSAAGY